MAKRILNKHNQVDVPTLILQNKNFDNLGTIVDASDLTYKENMNSANELSFTIYKDIEGKRNIIWDKITNGKVIYLPEFAERFEVTVTTTSENSVSKSITATSLCECELSQINIYNLEVNTETDIAREDYDADKPTIFYDEDDHSRSLLHRILGEKAKHYYIKYVDESLKNIQRMDLSFSDVDIYSLLTGDISEEFGCLFIFDSMDRSISVYDLYNTCYNNECKYRGDFSDTCPECGSKDVGGQYGDDTTVFITNDNLATQITLEPDWDSYKNCFYVEGGDDLINATIRMINPNGSNYIYYISEEMKEDMPSELVVKIDSYDEEYNKCMNGQEFVLNSDVVKNYNIVVDYVNAKFANDDKVNYSRLEAPIIGYSSITSMLYEAIDLYQFVKTSMMPTISTDHMTIDESLQSIISGLNTEFHNEIDVLNSTSIIQSKVESEILKLAKLFYGSAYYDLDVVTSSYTQATTTAKGRWTGKFIITSCTEKDENNEFISEESGQVTISIGDDYESYIQQSIAKEMADRDSLDEKNITSISMNDSTFEEQIGYYSYDELNSLYESFKSCLDVLLIKKDEDSKNIHEDIRNKYSGFYTDRCNIIDQQMQVIDNYLEYINAVYYYDSETYETSGVLNDIVEEVNERLNFERYIGEDWHTFCSYRREDKYSNSNIISDGLTNTQLVEYAKNLYEDARKELYKAGTLQYSISTTMNNLLVLPEFKPFAENFAVGNWIRVGMDDKVYKLRLLSYQISFDEIQTINVEFSTVTKISDGISDVKSILDSAQSMASSYDGIKTLTENNTKKTKYVSTWISDGFRLTNQKIVSGANNQTVTVDEHGITAVKYDDYGNVDNCQLKIFNNGMYITEDGWRTIKTGVGKFIYIDPKDWKEHDGYGVIADTVVGSLILGENLGIYNSNGSLQFDEKGLVITNYNKENKPKNSFIVNPNDNEKLLRITKNGEDVFYTGSDGNLYIKGNITANSGKIANFNVNENELYTDGATFANTTGMYFGNSGLRLGSGFKVDINGDIISQGNFSFANRNLIYDSSNGLVINGEIHADKGSIGDMIIEGGFLKSNSNVSYNGYNYSITIVGTTNSELSGHHIRLSCTNNKTLGGSNNDTYYFMATPVEFNLTVGTHGWLTFNSIDKSIEIHNNSFDLSVDDTNSEMEIKNIIADEKITAKTIYFGNQPDTDVEYYLRSNGNIYGNSICACGEPSSQTIGKYYIKKSNATVNTNIPVLELLLLANSDDIDEYWVSVGNNGNSVGLRLRGKSVKLVDASGVTTSSDERLKNSFKSLDEFDDVFSSLNPIAFKYKNGTSDRYHFGFKAQEVRDALLNNGFTTKDFGGFVQYIDDPNSDDYCGVEDPMGLIYTEFTAWNTHMIQKLYKENEALKQEIKEIKEAITNL